MQYGNAIPLGDRAKFSEGSRLASARDSRSNSQLWKKVSGISKQQYATVEQLQKAVRQISKQRRRILGGGLGGAGIQWQAPYKELNPLLLVSANTLVYISPQNPIATVGLVDLQSSGATLQATSGIWLALMDVAGATSAGYQVPQDPVPGSGLNYDAGPPVVGDLDVVNAPLIYWLLIKSVC